MEHGKRESKGQMAENSGLGWPGGSQNLGICWLGKMVKELSDDSEDRSSFRLRRTSPWSVFSFSSLSSLDLSSHSVGKREWPILIRE